MDTEGDDDFELTEAQKAEIDRRLESHRANPAAAIPWEQVRDGVRARLAAKGVRTENYWMKMIGTSEIPCPDHYTKNYVEFRREPRQLQLGDVLVLYAVGGAKRIFALAEVISELKASDHEGWPLRVDIEYLDGINLPIEAGVPIDSVSTEVRDLLQTIRTGQTYFRLSDAEYTRAESLLRAAHRVYTSEGRPTSG